MRPNRLREVLARKDIIVNSWHAIPSAYLAESASQQGFDSVTIDLQHGMIGFETAIAMLQAISSSAAVPLVRVTANRPDQIMRILDAGAYGIICPMVSNAADARCFSDACRYPPAGNRSYGPARGLLYGGSDYADNANTEILVIPMIETEEALDNIAVIAGMEQIDMIYIGPNDLALALGERPGAEIEPSRTLRAIEHIRSTCASVNKPVGIFCANTEIAKLRAGQGFDLVTPGSDFSLATRAMAQAVKDLRGIDG